MASAGHAPLVSHLSSATTQARGQRTEATHARTQQSYVVVEWKERIIRGLKLNQQIKKKDKEVNKLQQQTDTSL